MRAIPSFAIWVAVVPFLLCGPADAGPDGSSPPVPRFTETDDARAEEGHATLSWSLPGGDDATDPPTFELQKSRDPEFSNHRVLHRGPENTLFVSGLKTGRTYFRVRAVLDGSAGPWSATRSVDVAYPGRGQVLWLLLVGCVVFVATVAAILLGWVRYRRPPLAVNRADA